MENKKKIVIILIAAIIIIAVIALILVRGNSPILKSDAIATIEKLDTCTNYYFQSENTEEGTRFANRVKDNVGIQYKENENGIDTIIWSDMNKHQLICVDNTNKKIYVKEENADIKNGEMEYVKVSILQNSTNYKYLGEYKYNKKDCYVVEFSKGSIHHQIWIEKSSKNIIRIKGYSVENVQNNISSEILLNCIENETVQEINTNEYPNYEIINE